MQLRHMAFITRSKVLPDIVVWAHLGCVAGSFGSGRLWAFPDLSDALAKSAALHSFSTLHDLNSRQIFRTASFTRNSMTALSCACYWQDSYWQEFKNTACIVIIVFQVGQHLIQRKPEEGSFKDQGWSLHSVVYSHCIQIQSFQSFLFQNKIFIKHRRRRTN